MMIWKVGQLEKHLIIDIEQLSREPYSTILCYPRASKDEVKKRLRQLAKIKVTAFEFVGYKQVLNLQILGKGCVGLVVLAQRDDKHVALKIRRIDADRLGMQREAKLLSIANSVEIGPRLLDVSKDFLVMEFVDGNLLPEWLVKTRSKRHVKTILREILEQCWQLDRIGLDHGELSHAPKHIMVNREGRPVLVDFETASMNRRSSNVTSICQFLFLGSEVAEIIAKKIGVIDKNDIVEALRRYKKDSNRERFELVLSACRL